MEFSKKMLVLHIFISVVLCAITVAGTLRGWDVTAIAVLAGTSMVTDGTWGGFYLWKSKNENRAKYAGHREQILQRLLEVYCSAQMDENTKSYCFFRIAQAAADHLTTLYMYLPNRSQGRREGLKWERFLQENYPAFYSAARKKGFLLRQLCRVHLSLPAYQRLKKALLK